MSLFGSLMGDFDEDIFGNHMNAMNMQMRSMNRLMNSFMPDPFNMLTNFDGGFQQNALMERQNPHQMGGLFGFPAMPTMPNMNRLLSTDIGNNAGAFCSSSVITMSSGPDGRPQIYQATSSTKTGPGGIRETRRTVQDSVNGVKKMAIGHHIGERAHIIEKEQDLRSGQLEEHQEFINLEEDDAEDFDREFTTKAHGAIGRGGARAICGPTAAPQQALTIEEIDDDDEIIETVPHVQLPSSSSSQNRRHLPTITAPIHTPSSSQTHQNSSAAKLITSTSSLATNMSPSSFMSTNNANVGPSALYTTSTEPSATTTAPSTSITTTTSGMNIPYFSTDTPTRRASYRHNHYLKAASSRRPLRTASSSPLATTPTLHSHGTPSTPSVHPHPYNTSAARRSHHHHHHQHRPKQHATKHHATPSLNINKTNSTPPQAKVEEQNSK